MTRIIISSVLLMVGISFGGCSRTSEATPRHESDESATHATSAPAGKTDPSTSTVIAISVGDDGFQPSHVTLKKGQKSTLRFTRTSDQTCAKDVAFPELGIKKPLPLNRPVEVSVPTDKARTLTFQCGMGMYKSSVIIS